MSIKDKGALLNWGLVVAIAVSGLAAVAAVIVNSTATKAISAQAERSLLIAEMQQAVQIESEAAALFVAHLPDMTMEPAQGMDEESVHDDDTDPTNLADHPGVQQASSAFRQAADQALSMSSETGDAERIRAAIGAHEVFVASLTRLNEATHTGGDAMAIYHADTRSAEGDLVALVQELRGSTISDLEEAVERSEWSQRLLAIILPIAAAGALIAVVWLVRARRARHHVKFLEHVIAEKERFIGTVSHELRTPLAAIVGFTELMSSTGEHLSESEQREYLELILTQGNEVSAIVDDLLVAARAEIGELTLVKVPVDLAAQTRQVVEALSFDGDKPAVPDSSVVGFGDPGRVRQILRNLLTNAVRYGGPIISVDIQTHAGMAQVRIVDDGEPIPLEERERIFEPYTTLSDSRPVTGSIGLGLTVSKQLAVLMDGDLRYEPGAGQNAFTLTIPVPSEQPRRGRHQDAADGEPASHAEEAQPDTSRRLENARN
jgi:signal transduction histidine kinase